ncbi:protein HESO1-like [Argentina anserina]|uniref:protein HESO1-like n=1 Tax=Argentina anserina TaxID=57926 RepID=UPI0021765B27|nr:protein HESO1-like [Potentilla anserina]XP_050384981.1 protein HESO1-like [Potentilla anserina]XP_050384982.1 protein HESO1-like [Potentilla anserina]
MAESNMENTLREILHAIEPSRMDREIRRQILQELQGVVESVETLSGATVEPFGSFVSELFTRWGDLDVSVEFSKGSYISSSGKKHKKEVLRDVMKAMRRRGWNICRFIPNARVPILMVKSNHQSNSKDISCDISVNNLKAQMKSKLLLWITDIDPRFHDMILLVKEWAKAHNINDSKTGTFNSYSLSMLVVFHFQTCVPAVLPPLQDIYPGTLTDDLQGLRDDAERRIENNCVENIRKYKTSRLRARNESSLSELFISFLGKFVDLSSKASELGICTYSGKWEAIESNMGRLPKTYCILVEDPFDRPENSARGVSARALNRISEVFEMSRSRLIAACYSSSLAIDSSLLHTLVRPGTVHLIIGNRDYNIEQHQPTDPHHFISESSHSRTTRHYNGPPKPFDPFIREMVPRKNHTGTRVPTGYVRELVDSSPQVHQQLRKLVHSSSQVRPHIQKLVNSSSQILPRVQKSVHSTSQVQSPLQITKPEKAPMVDSSPQVHQQLRKPVQSSSQVRPQMQEPVNSSSQILPHVRKSVHSTSQVQSPLQKTKPGKAPMVQVHQEWRPKKPGMQL